MARRTKVVKIEADNRDHGKQFLITEMPPRQGERLARRCVQAIIKANPELGNSLMPDSGTSMLELAKAGFKALGSIDNETADDLFDEMLTCVQVLLPDGTSTRKLGIAGDDIEELATFFELRKQIFALHTGFFMSGE